MIEMTAGLKSTKHLTREQALRIVQTACIFESHILFKCENSIINAKSLLGVLSMNIPPDEPLMFSCEGSDEQEAAEALAKCFAAL